MMGLGLGVFPGSAKCFVNQGERDGTDEHRQPEVGEDRAAQGDDRKPGEALDKEQRVHRDGRQWLAEHAPEDHDDRRAEHGEADYFQAVAHRRGVSHSDRWWRWRRFGSCFRAGAKRQGTTGGGQQQE